MSGRGSSERAISWPPGPVPRAGRGTRSARVPARRRSAVACSRGSGARRRARRGPVSTHLALAQHRDPVGDVVHDGQVVADEDARRSRAPPGARVNSSQHLRLHRHVERAGRLVGDHQRGSQRERAGEGDPLALAAGELARAAARRGRRGSRTASSSSATRASRAAPRRPTRCRSSGSRTHSPTVIRGSSEAAGSWCTNARSRRRSRSCRPRRARQVVAVDQDRARTRRGTSPAATRPRVVLPEPDSPTRPSTSPRAHAEGDAARPPGRPGAPWRAG